MRRSKAFKPYGYFAPRAVAKKFLDRIHDDYKVPKELYVTLGNEEIQERWFNYVKKFRDEYHIATEHDLLLQEDEVMFDREEELTYFLLKWG